MGNLVDFSVHCFEVVALFFLFFWCFCEPSSLAFIQICLLTGIFFYGAKHSLAAKPSSSPKGDPGDCWDYVPELQFSGISMVT